MDAGLFANQILYQYHLMGLVQATGLVHDLGKLLLVFGSQGQWDVVGVSY